MTDVLVCAKLTTPLWLADNRVGVCAECGCGVQYRPHAPRSRKICQGCFIKQAERAAEAGEPISLYTTEQMLADFAAYRRRKMS
jgi:hypothetical protein